MSEPRSTRPETDGPLRGPTHLPRAVGSTKPHSRPPIGRLNSTRGGQPGPPGSAPGVPDRYLLAPARVRPAAGVPTRRSLAGVVRVECPADLPSTEVVRLADQSAATLCRYASSEYQDTRASQNLYPIVGLERQLGRWLRHSRLWKWSLQPAAT